MIKITTPSRLHITLIDLNASIGRVDGGIGLTIEEPGFCITAERSDAPGKVVVTSEAAGGSAHTGRMHKSAATLLPDWGGIRIHIEHDAPSHVGLGSGTQGALAAGMAVNRLYDLGLSVRDIAIRVGRGGTSGIGVAAFESGGFILDGGHAFSEKGAFKPSAASKSPPAPILFQHPFPDWEIVLAIPDARGAHDDKEVDIFEQECPIPLHEVQELSHIILMETLPSVVEEDIESFGDSINRIQNTGFKRREIALQRPEIPRIIELMQENTCGAGMSSFGPVVYGITDNKRDAGNAMRLVREFLDETTGGCSIVTHASNSGADVS
ncbi:MAG TPA: beta-ribofuranosylaminobenzene 5'-phosphate synthase [Methanosarcinales archaeon]|nr:beta-ribofuranosylaminobenzene 5'-phosphate synthase [Methanosarcinales archaeon]